MRLASSLQIVLLLALFSSAEGLNIPLEVEQLPTIINYTKGPIVVLPFDHTITIRCEAKGNPLPKYRWTKDGLDFIPSKTAMISGDLADGTFVLSNEQLDQFQGKYRCYAFNKLGTAMTEEIELKVPTVPKFPREIIDTVVVEEGESFSLECNPPEGVAPRKIHWMSIGLQHIEQDERVTMGTDGSLYFSNALQKDSRPDYCCFADFPRIRTIVQKTAIAVEVNRVKPNNESDDSSNAMRRPILMLPSGVQTEKVLVKGEELQLECIPGGFPTPKIQWMKMGHELSSRTKISNFGKLLTISAIEARDEGKYMCTAESPAGQAVHYFDVIVEEPPTWLTEPPESQLNVIGSDFHMKCSVTGTPQPDIVWRRNGQIFEDDPLNNRRVLDDTVVLHSALPEDSAVYQCEASNRHGSILANINIMVMNMAPLILTEDFLEYPVVLGGNVTLSCYSFGSPSPDITWTKDEIPETIKGERFFSLQNGSLQINHAEKGDSGEYVCVAFNSEGKSVVTAVLAVKDPTKIVYPPLNAEIISGSTAQFKCQAEYDESLQKTLQIVWRVNGKDIPLSLNQSSRYSADNGSLRIMDVNLGDQGEYTCTARTSLDEDSATALLTVLDVPDAPRNVVISELDSLRNISLSWTPGSDHNSPITEFIVEFEESQWEPGRWKELQKVPGNQATAELALNGHLSYQFRLYAVNAIGPGPPSGPTVRYKTPPAAPDKNPKNIIVQGHLPHQLDISWEPLPPVEHNGPGLEYKVSFRKLGVDDIWKEHLVKRQSFVVKNVSTFMPYEVKVQSRNSHGWGPQPKTVSGYSGEDVPSAAPRDVAVEVINTTVLRVSWTAVPPSTVRGHLRGYQVHWRRTRSFTNPNKTLDERHSLSSRGNRNHVIVPGLQPFSEYSLTINVFNKKGNGPKSDPVTFNTPEGVPDPVPILTTSNAHRDSILLVWGPPLQANGILTGYLLQYFLLNETTMEVVDSQEMNITGPDTTHWQLQGLKEGSLYRFHLSACTRVGCGPWLVQENMTVTPIDVSATATATVPPVSNSHKCSLSFPTSLPGNSTQPPLVPGLLNISSYVSDTYAKISWTATEEQKDSQLYVAYMNNRDGSWRISEAVNTTQSFHIIDGLKPGTVYTVRLMAKKLIDNASIFEDVIQTRFKVLTIKGSSSSSNAMLIGTLCAVALLTLIVLTACFLWKNKGGKYAVKEKEDLHSDEETQPMNDDTFCEYSDSEEQPLKCRSSRSLNGDAAVGDAISRDSLVDYADGGGEYNEDGSFIGEYSDHKHGESLNEASGLNPVIA